MLSDDVRDRASIKSILIPLSSTPVRSRAIEIGRAA